MTAKTVATWCVLVGLAAGAGAAEKERPWPTLDGTSKTAAWNKRVARLKELLGKVDRSDPLTVKYAPNIRRHVDMIQREKSFDWKRVTAVAFLENMLTDLLAGEQPHRRYAGKGVAVAYWSELMGRIEAIWVHVPPGYDPAREYQIVMCYKCGGGIHYKEGKAAGGYRPTVQVANQTDTFFAWSSLSTQVKGRMGAVDELREAMPAICSEFAVSPDRVFLTGWSDGGFTAIWLAAHHPHLVAGILPNCANWQYSNVGQVGLYNVPFLVVDGWFDGGFVQRNMSRWHVLRSMGYPVGGIMGQHGHAYKPYEDVEELKRILAWAKARRRNLWPRRVRYATWSLTRHRAYWVSIERMIEPALAAQIDVRAGDGNRIEVDAHNVGAFRLTLSEKLIDPARPVTVITNGRGSYSGPAKAELTVHVTPPPKAEFVKTPATPGGIGARVVRSYYGLRRKGGFRMRGRRWLSVRGTGGDEATRKLLTGWAPESAKADTDVTAADMARYDLYLYGGPDVNSLTARMAGKLPVTFGKGRFTVGAKVYDRPGNCVKFIHPNPLSPGRLVIIYAFNDAKDFAAAKFRVTDARGRRSTLAGESAWRFRDGDCQVFALPAEPRKWGVGLGQPAERVDSHIFDATWRATPRPPVGELKTPLDYTQLLRLRADAAREAAGADVGIVWSYTPGWIRWRTTLPAGPVSVHDLSLCDLFPEYLTVAEATGAQLYRVEKSRRGERATGLLTGATATSVLTRRDDPAYVPGTSLALDDIDPTKTYRIAMGYHGLPAYGVNYRSMPALFSFGTPEEFLAGKHTSLPFGNPRQVPIQMTQAVARYIAKRKAVTVRPTCFDLTSYIMNPEANHFGAMDWLHVGADGVPKRYTLSLGLRGQADPDLAPPRDDAKTFLDANFAAAGQKERVDFSKMGLKLPVEVTLASRAFGIAAGEDGKSFRSVEADAAGTIGSAVVVDIQLVNRGDKDVAGVAVLASTAMQRVNPGSWPSVRAWPKDKPKPYYAGFHGAIGPRRKPPIHENAALFVQPDGTPSLSKLLARNVGYNAGLVGLRRSVQVKAKQSLSMPLVLIAVNSAKDKPTPLTGVMDGLKAEILNGPLGGGTKE